ncbi:MAG: site-2 protease family protein [Pseudomonadales bacterium]
MSESLFSAHWYRVQALKPQLRVHTKLHRHDYRGQIWYVLQDNSSSRYHRFSSAAYEFIGLMDGTRSVQEIWHRVNTLLGDDAPTQDDIIQLLAQLHSRDVLQCDIPADTDELFRRAEAQEKAQWQGRFKNPLSIRIPLVDPESWLNRSMVLVAPLFSWPALLVYVIILGAAVLFAGVHWQDIRAEAMQHAFSAQNLLLIFLTYPIVKLLHEFGHAYAAKLEGGEVHEMGIMLLVLMPIPYVDASAATAFRSKYKRMLVGAAGIMVELLLAALAFFVWLSVEPGLIRNLAFDVMLIGSVSTLLFNGNPLLRFDAYYVLADAIAIPNLAQRSNRYIGYLLQRYAFGLRDATSPVNADGEASWFFVYAIASFVYRLLLLVVIGFYLVQTFFFVGVALTLWAAINQLLLPMGKHLVWLFNSPSLRFKRARALTLSTVVCASLAALLALVPVTSNSRHEGLVWAPQDARVHAGTNGFVVKLLAEPGSLVSKGQALIEMRDPLLVAKRDVAAAKVKELRARYFALRATDLVQAKLMQEELQAARAELVHAQERVDSLLITSNTDGKLIVPLAQDLPGQFINQGQTLGYVIERRQATARVVVGQADIDRVRRRLLKVEVRLASAMSEVLAARVVRDMPQASYRLPSKVLSTEGGGSFVTDAQDEQGVTTREKLFQYELQLPLPMSAAHIGTRVHVLFDHGAEPLAQQWYRRVRQLFLRQLNV